MSQVPRGLYAITPDVGPDVGPDVADEDPARLADQVARAIAGGACLIQYRRKSGSAEQRLAEASALLRVCRGNATPLIVNDDVDLAEAIGADGIHVGREDLDPTRARRRLGTRAIVGVSCYDDLRRARAAQSAGASYVAFGSFFSSATKPGAVRPPIGLLTEARAALRVPLVAIGGITPQNGGPLVAAGADLLAVVTGVFSSGDARAAARAYTDLFFKEHPE